MCLNDLVANREAGSRAVEFLACMKPPKKLENRPVKLTFDADSIIADGNRDVGSWARIGRVARRVGAGLDSCVDFDPRIRTPVILYPITDEICQ